RLPPLHSFLFLLLPLLSCSPFFFNPPATTEISTLSLHDALPIWQGAERTKRRGAGLALARCGSVLSARVADYPGRVIVYGFFDPDRKSTRLNSSHGSISYAVFCLKKKI